VLLVVMSSQVHDGLVSGVAGPPKLPALSAY